MIEKTFVKENIIKVRLEEFLERAIGRANYSNVVVNRTPVSTRIIIYAQKPGLVIGRGGERINKIVETLKSDYGIENPVVEVEEVPNPDLDARIVAKNIALWLEKGGHYKRIGNVYLERIMNAGAVGAQIEISGKLTGERHRTEKFTTGHLKRSGKTAEIYMDYGFAIARTKPGVIGVKVRIMKEMPEYLKLMKKLKEVNSHANNKEGEDERNAEG